MKALKFVILLPVLWGVIVLTNCSKTVQYGEGKWKVFVDISNDVLSVQHSDLGDIVKDAKFYFKTNDQSTRLVKWTAKQEDQNVIITTQNPKQTKWEIAFTEHELNITSSVKNGLMVGLAPAPENRIPARIESQDNGIMYTALGLVSARNIYNLFDRKTDIMIQFPEKSLLMRDSSDAETMNVRIPAVQGPEISLIPEYYSCEVGLASYQKTSFKPVYKPIPERFKTAPTGWCSWYCYYMAASEEDMITETDALAKKLLPYDLEYVQLDACYTRGKQANYLDWNKESFPNGGKWLFQYIDNKGLKPGLWVNIYGANYANPACTYQYPEDFYLRDENGKLSSACCTADSTVVRLDYTNPDVIEQHLKPLFNTLVNDWALKYLKDAGWGTWMDYYEENKKNAFDSTMDSRIAYRNAQDMVRDIMGPNNYINGCAMHEVGVGFGYFDGSRTGGDDFAAWDTGLFGGMTNFFQSLFGANYLNGICWWSDPDVVMVRDPLTFEEGKTIVSAIALTGQTYMISDYLADFSRDRLQRFFTSKQDRGWASRYPDMVKALPENKVDLYRKTMPTMPIRAMDLYPFRSDPVVQPSPSEYPRALDLKVNAESGAYDVLAVFNWEDVAASKTISFASDLGLNPNNRYLVFDFWDQQLIGIYSDSIYMTIPKHGTKVFVIRPLSDKPQLLATTRHITGAYSIMMMNWNASEENLSGTSKTVANKPYTLFFHVPEKLTVHNVDVSVSDFTHEMISDRVLKIEFQGQESPVNWTIQFSES